MLFHNDPFRDLDALLSRPMSRSSAARTMPMDAYHRDTDVWVHIDMPGVAVDSVEIDVERDILTVAGERSWQSEESDQVYLNERGQGTYRRQVHLGEGLDADAIEADLHDGVLTLRIPVAEKAQPRKIEVKTKQPAFDATSA